MGAVDGSPGCMDVAAHPFGRDAGVDTQVDTTAASDLATRPLDAACATLAVTRTMSTGLMTLFINGHDLP
jgi:hypothetical protein